MVMQKIAIACMYVKLSMACQTTSHRWFLSYWISEMNCAVRPLGDVSTHLGSVLHRRVTTGSISYFVIFRFCLNFEK